MNALTNYKSFLFLFLAMVIPAGIVRAAPMTAEKMLKQPDAWFTTDLGKTEIDRIISHQLKSGGWDKGYDSSNPPAAPAAAPANDGKSSWAGLGTIDNAITYTELKLIARAYALTKRENLPASFNHGIDFLLAAQYPNGGWPQRFPLPDNYGKLITFNDNAMLNVLSLFHEIVQKESPYEWVDATRREKVKAAYDRGIDCLLKCQVVVNGKLTVWGQQHDPETLKPAKARAYELPGLSAGESSKILKYFMTLENPSAEIQKSVHAGCKWFAEVKITGKKLTRKTGEMTDDPTAEPLWARFYEIETNRPFFCGRDSIKKYVLTEIEAERIKGYSWYSTYGNSLLQHYEKWAKKYPAK